MMDCDRWDVVTALFPFVDAPVRKPRPVLILSAHGFNREHGHVVGCMITTASAGRWLSDHPIIDLAAAGLSRPSVVRWKVFTLADVLLGRRIGNLSEADSQAVATRRATILG